MLGYFSVMFLAPNSKMANSCRTIHNPARIRLDHFIKVKLFSFIHRVLKLVVELFLLKSAKFARYRKFGVFVFDGHFDRIA
jgi:hypothetical protein